jgi:hypothetical protein
MVHRTGGGILSQDRASDNRTLFGGFAQNQGWLNRPLNKVYTPVMKEIGSFSKALGLFDRRADAGCLKGFGKFPPYRT